MDPLKNPFSPGAGTPPPELAGRQPLLDKAVITLTRLKQGRPEKSLLLVGLRGVGKTVLLNKIKKLADQIGYKSFFIETRENTPLARMIIPPLREILYSLDRMENTSQKVKRGLRVLRSFLNGFRLKVQDFEVILDVSPEMGAADSGDLESDLPALLEAIGEAASDRGIALAMVMDEMQYLTEVELSALIMACHRMAQKQLPVVLVGAGLPQLRGLSGKSKSYAERMFDFRDIGPLGEKDAAKALQEPVKEYGMEFTAEALKEIMRNTRGYPYFIQMWGQKAWNLAEENSIGLQTVKRATVESIDDLDESFFRVRFDRLTPREKDYMRALAEMGDGPQRSGEIADLMGVKSQSIAPMRSNLMKKGMIYSPAHGDTEFTVPLFDDFMKRIMPEMAVTKQNR